MRKITGVARSRTSTLIFVFTRPHSRRFDLMARARAKTGRRSSVSSLRSGVMGALARLQRSLMANTTKTQSVLQCSRFAKDLPEPRLLQPNPLLATAHGVTIPDARRSARPAGVLVRGSVHP